MKLDTIRYLNQLNRNFYDAVADDFDQTRGTAWRGWTRLVPFLKTPLSVLDIGCGNGRFGVFLWEEMAKISSGSIKTDAPLITYDGIDSSSILLARAQTTLDKLGKLAYHLSQQDIVENPPVVGDYDLVVLLGVLHHIPGYEERQAFIRHLASRVKPGGLLMFTAWRFYEYPRFRERIAQWPDGVTVESNDYLLDWRRGTVSLRYCHYTDDAEHDALVAASGLTEILTFRADGQDGAANRYSLLRK
ncbi:MAG: class I SAM-dependent methyltransferase [Anaerolineae bacterium]